jgi:hypothetical protein
MLPTDKDARKSSPIYSGLLRYFPLACAYVAHVSHVGNEQHNPGEPLHWAREKSSDHGDCLVRHQVEAGMNDTDGIRHSGKVAWRALAQLELELEAAAKETKAIVADEKLGQLSAGVSGGEVMMMIDPEALRRHYRRLDATNSLQLAGCDHRRHFRARDSRGNIRCFNCGNILVLSPAERPSSPGSL